MSGYTYHERDYAFGQAMLTQRTLMSLTQVELARSLGISRVAVQGWEAGRSYPKAEHLKRFIALGVKLQAFAAGREEGEIRVLWKAAHQKVLLDEPWLSSMLEELPPLLTPRRASSNRGERRQCTARGSVCSQTTGGLGRCAGGAELLWAKA